MSQTTPQGIPIRRVLLSHLSELPNDYGTTPGGTMFSTTPGGTRIIYDRSFLLKCRSSPMSNTPPSNLPDIPGVTSPDKNPAKMITKIPEENEAVGKENGGKFHLHCGFGYDGYMNRKSPLQQYRQRSMFQQKAALYEKACQEISDAQSAVINRGVNIMPPPPCSPIMQQPGCISLSNNYSGDGAWHQNHDAVMMPPNRKTCPTSQLSLWRQTKLNQAISQAVAQPVSQASQVVAPNPSNLPPGHPGLSLYRGRERANAQGAWPANLCNSLEKLFKTHSGSAFLPNQVHANAVCNNYTPAYGNYNYGREAGNGYNANIIQ